MEYTMEAIGHSNIKTTQNYFTGFDDETKQDFADNLLKNN